MKKMQMAIAFGSVFLEAAKKFLQNLNKDDAKTYFKDFAAECVEDYLKDFIQAKLKALFEGRDEEVNQIYKLITSTPSLKDIVRLVPSSLHQVISPSLKEAMNSFAAVQADSSSSSSSSSSALNDALFVASAALMSVLVVRAMQDACKGAGDGVAGDAGAAGGAGGAAGDAGGAAGGSGMNAEASGKLPEIK